MILNFFFLTSNEQTDMKKHVLKKARINLFFPSFFQKGHIIHFIIQQFS